MRPSALLVTTVLGLALALAAAAPVWAAAAAGGAKPSSCDGGGSPAPCEGYDPVLNSQHACETLLRCCWSPDTRTCRQPSEGPLRERREGDADQDPKLRRDLAAMEADFGAADEKPHSGRVGEVPDGAQEYGGTVSLPAVSFTPGKTGTGDLLATVEGAKVAGFGAGLGKPEDQPQPSAHKQREVDEAKAGEHAAGEEGQRNRTAAGPAGDRAGDHKAGEGSAAEAPAPAALPGAPGGTVDRGVILERALAWVKANVRFSPKEFEAEDPKSPRTGQKYRADSTGLVSMAWKLGRSLTPDTLESGAPCERVPVDSLEPGDALIRPHVHATLFNGWVEGSERRRYHALENVQEGVGTVALARRRPSIHDGKEGGFFACRFGRASARSAPNLQVEDRGDLAVDAPYGQDGTEPQPPGAGSEHGAADAPAAAAAATGAAAPAPGTTTTTTTTTTSTGAGSEAGTADHMQQHQQHTEQFHGANGAQPQPTQQQPAGAQAPPAAAGQHAPFGPAPPASTSGTLPSNTGGGGAAPPPAPPAQSGAPPATGGGGLFGDNSNSAPPPQTQPQPSGSCVRRPASGQRMNRKGLEMLKHWEGFANGRCYKDPVGIWTIGYGHACHANNDAYCRGCLSRGTSQTITEADATALLAQDLARFERCVSERITVPLTSNEFSSIVSFAYNLGCAGGLHATDSTLRRILNQGNYAGVPEQLMRWTKSGGRELQGLVNRRNAERQLWLDQACEGDGAAQPGEQPAAPVSGEGSQPEPAAPAPAPATGGGALQPTTAPASSPRPQQRPEQPDPEDPNEDNTDPGEQPQAGDHPGQQVQGGTTTGGGGSCGWTTYSHDTMVAEPRSRPICISPSFKGSMDKIAAAAAGAGVRVKVTSSARASSRVTGAIVQPSKISNHMAGHAIDFNVWSSTGSYCNSGCLKQYPGVHSSIKKFLDDVQAAGVTWGRSFNDVIHFDDRINVQRRSFWDDEYKAIQTAYRTKCASTCHQYGVG